jgi:hypothetical protein
VNKAFRNGVPAQFLEPPSQLKLDIT